MKELKAYSKVLLQAVECKEVSFTVAEEQLRYHHYDLSYTSDAGEFSMFVGSNVYFGSGKSNV